jgi:acetyl-CoA synthetase
VVGRPDDMKGQAVVAFVTLEGGRHSDPKLREELRQHVVKEIGALARPDDCASPTRCRRRAAARSCAACCGRSRAGDETLGDTTTLEDLSVLAKLREDDE